MNSGHLFVDFQQPGNGCDFHDRPITNLLLESEDQAVVLTGRKIIHGKISAKCEKQMLRHPARPFCCKPTAGCELISF
jgi:hypothetical protein